MNPNVLLNVLLEDALITVAFLIVLGIGFGTQAIYSRLRRPGKDAEFVANWRVPGGGWILAGIVLVVLCCLAFVLTRDPLSR